METESTGKPAVLLGGLAPNASLRLSPALREKQGMGAGDSGLNHLSLFIAKSSLSPFCC